MIYHGDLVLPRTGSSGDTKLREDIYIASKWFPTAHYKRQTGIFTAEELRELMTKGSKVTPPKPRQAIPMTLH